MTNKFIEDKLKEWFEENYLDGDSMQEGQTLSSEECLDAILQIYKQSYQAGFERAFEVIRKGDEGYDHAFEELKKEMIKINEKI